MKSIGAKREKKIIAFYFHPYQTHFPSGSTAFVSPNQNLYADSAILQFAFHFPARTFCEFCELEK